MAVATNKWACQAALDSASTVVRAGIFHTLLHSVETEYIQELLPQSFL